MKNVIFYFTGTGNSLFAAKEIAKNLGDTKIISIHKGLTYTEEICQYERIGFIFPVYFYYMPSIVEDFIKTLQFSQSQYIFGVATYGAMMGMTMEHLKKCIESQGGILNGEFGLNMPGNYIAKYGAFPQFIQNKLFKSSGNKIREISRIIFAKQIKRKKAPNAFVKTFNNYAQDSIKQFDKNAENFCVNNNCNGCGTCQKVCPVNNIKLDNKKPKWGNTCQQCMACIQWCPSKAVEYADKTQKRKRYLHPHVKLQDMIHE